MNSVNTFESCGVSNCFNPTIGFTEVESIYKDRKKNSLCMSICSDHKKWIEKGGYMIDNCHYDSREDYLEKSYGRSSNF